LQSYTFGPIGSTQRCLCGGFRRPLCRSGGLGPVD